MSDLAEFLLARIAEDEEVARAASPGPWLAGSTADHLANEVVYGQSMPWPGHIAQVCNVDYGQNKRPDEGHIARWDPARVLAECEAKRRIIEDAEFVANHGPAVDHVRALDMTTGAMAAFRDVLGWLAQPYRAHPDYRAKWAPHQD